MYNSQEIEIVPQFKYLGFTFQPTLTFTKHCDNIVSKARSAYGFLFGKMHLNNLPLDLALKVWKVYVMPTFTYGTPLWFSKLSKNSKESLDSTFSKFLKRCLGVSKFSNNSIVHYLTWTDRLSNTLAEKAKHQFGGLYFPTCLSGMQLTLFQGNANDQSYNDVYDGLPDYFHQCPIPIPEKLPNNFVYRRRIVKSILDCDHYKNCKDKTFHLYPKDTCICGNCGEANEPYHSFNCKM